MMKIIPILIIGILVISGFGVAAVTNNNSPPDMPKVAGVTHPKIGVVFDYTIWTTDPDGDDVSYYIDWGDGNTTGWIGPFASGEEAIASHAWYEAGCYFFECKAKDHPYEAESKLLEFVIKVPPKNKIVQEESGIINCPPVRTGRPGVEYAFTYSAVSPVGDNYYIMWDWDDGAELTWDGPYASGELSGASHAWMRRGDYYVRLKIKFDGSGELDWELLCLMKIRWLSNSEYTNQQSFHMQSSQNTMSTIPSSMAILENCTLSGYVSNIWGQPLEGALVRVYYHETYVEDYSDEEGHYTVPYIPTCYCLKNISCSKECYITEWVQLVLVEYTVYDFILNTTNHPPTAPWITGPGSIPSRTAKVVVAEPLNFPPGEPLDFKFKATDPDGDDIRYRIDWGDGTSDITDFYPSGVEIIANHTYDNIGTFTITAAAEDTCGLIGPEGTMGIPIVQSSQQSTIGSSSQNVMSTIIPSAEKTEVPTSGTIVNDGSLSGYVNDTSGNPIEGALVRVYFHETYEEDYSDEDGYYHVTNIPICYCLKNATCSEEWYKTEWVLLSIVENTTHDFILTTNHPPTAPEIDGPKSGKVGVFYNYTFVSTDPNDDDIIYHIYWGDMWLQDVGPYPSGEVITVSHYWIYEGTYTIMAQAEDTEGLLSDPSWFEVTMPRDKATTYLLLLRFLEKFPLLERILMNLR